MDALQIDEIARRHGIALILEFGSTVTGREHPRSDVDVGVLLHRPAPSFDELGALGHDLGRLYPGREVDVAIINHADPLFLKRITDHCRLVHGSPRRLAELRMYAFTRYQDHRRYLALEPQYIRRTLARLALP